MAGLVLMTMIVAGTYIHLQKQKRQTGTTSRVSTPAQAGITMSAVSMDMRPNDAALAAAAAETQTNLSHEGDNPRGMSVASA